MSRILYYNIEMLEMFLQKLKGLVPAQWRWVFDHSGVRRYSANTGWLFAGQMVSLVVAFFVGAYIARYLGPEKFGAINYAIGFSSILAFLAGFGIDTILKRDLLTYPERQAELLGTAFWLKLGAGFATLCLVNLVSLGVNHDAVSRLLIFIFSFTFILTSFNVLSTYFQARVQAKKVILAQMGAAFVSTILKLMFIYLGFGAPAFVAVYLADGIVLACGLYYEYRADLETPRAWKFDTLLAKNMCSAAVPLTLTYVMIMVYLKIDQVILKNIAGEQVLGLYSVAVKISEVLYMVPTLLCASLFPAIVNAKSTNALVYQKRLMWLYGALFVLAVLIAAPLSFGARYIIPFLFGAEYGLSVPIFQIYIWSVVPMFLITAVTQYLIAEDYTTIYLYSSAIGALSNTVLNLALIPRFGAVGAAITTLISYSLVPLSLLLFKKTRTHLRWTEAAVPTQVV